MTTNRSYCCVPSVYGWSASPLPTAAEINRFYREQYYQQPTGQYKHEYDAEELSYFDDRARLTLAFAAAAGVAGGRVLDVGCGEGFFLKTAAAAGFDVWGVDHSLFGLKQHNPDLMNEAKFKALNILDNDHYFDAVRFDLICCKNVVEHVLDPDALMTRIREHLADGGIGIVEVPNDFSLLHKDVFANAPPEEAPFFCPPVHLHYFNTDTIRRLIERAGLRILDFYSDYPIDHLLLESAFDYYNNKNLGPRAHSLRRKFMNLLGRTAEPERLGLFRALFSAGLGRDISVVFARF